MRLLRKFRRDKRGAAAVEFALIAPAMVMMYAGLVEICQAMIAERKANHVASAIGDLTTQVESVSTTDLTDIFSIGNTVMAPFDTSSLQMRLTSVTADATGTPKLDWSRGSGGFAAAASAPSLPMTLAAGDSIVIAESRYQYTSVMRYFIPAGLNYSEVYYLRPRRSDKVTCTGC
ncbi:MAG: TadE/TadG family type IV pilus assembly protein [Phenylobacterium sp.]